MKTKINRKTGFVRLYKNIEDPNYYIDIELFGFIINVYTDNQRPIFHETWLLNILLLPLVLLIITSIGFAYVGISMVMFPFRLIKDFTLYNKLEKISMFFWLIIICLLLTYFLL